MIISNPPHIYKLVIEPKASDMLKPPSAVRREEYKQLQTVHVLSRFDLINTKCDNNIELVCEQNINN